MAVDLMALDPFAVQIGKFEGSAAPGATVYNSQAANP